MQRTTAVSKNPGIALGINLLVVLACFSYPISTVALLWTGLPTGSANFYLKAIYAAYYLFLFLVLVFRSSGISNSSYALVLFLGIYAIRLLVDVLVFDISLVGYSQGHVMLYYFGLVLLPVLVISSAHAFIDVVKLADWVFIALVLSNTLLVLFAFTSDDINYQSFFSGRFQVDAGDDHERAILSPLTYGLHGASIAIFSLAKIATADKFSPIRLTVLFIFASVGISNIMLGASRGPLFSFVIALAILLYWLGNSRRSGSNQKKYAGRFFLLLLVPPAFLALSSETFSSSFLFQRVASFIEERQSGSIEGRDILLRSAISDFLNEPLLGSQFTTKAQGDYPHNIPVEVLMATGVVGGIVFLFALRNLVGSIRVMWRKSGPELSLVLCGMCFLLYGMTSGSIHSSPEFWTFFALFTVLGRRKLRVGRERLFAPPSHN